MDVSGVRIHLKPRRGGTGRNIWDATAGSKPGCRTWPVAIAMTYHQSFVIVDMPSSWTQLRYARGDG